jgi:hypothetical protein
MALGILRWRDNTLKRQVSGSGKTFLLSPATPPCMDAAIIRKGEGIAAVLPIYRK